ncbi:hypothetical protein EVJ58_g8190 [Rhodofomes roseus]|uniref:Uncharacterized protein n=1 Tax=Rhodofomes roseus TaxID=34475 RepID=A0A4Y9Y1E8_9APHY|nr:hypothetical protein EVJ58_g8190 [Rhodofomes roseus]
MSPPLWATPPQATLLQSFVAEHQDRQRERKLPQFWSKLFTAWFADFPEERALFPDRDMDADEPLSEEQKAALGAAIKSRKKKARKARSKPKVHLNLLKPSKKRSLAAHELYSQKYHEEKIKPLVQARIDAGEINPKQRLKHSMELAKTLLAQEPAEVREGIEAEAAALKAARNSLGSEDSMDGEFNVHRVQAVVDDMGAIFNQFFGKLHSTTGGSWFYFTMGCGINPDGGQRLELYTHCSGAAASKVSFSQAHPEAVAALGKEFLAWVKQAMSPQVHAAIKRALNRTSPDGGNPDDDDVSEGGEDEDEDEDKDRGGGEKGDDEDDDEDDEDDGGEKDDEEDDGEKDDDMDGGEKDNDKGHEDDRHDKSREATVSRRIEAVAGATEADALCSYDGMVDGPRSSVHVLTLRPSPLPTAFNESHQSLAVATPASTPDTGEMGATPSPTSLAAPTTVPVATSANANAAPASFTAPGPTVDTMSASWLDSGAVPSAQFSYQNISMSPDAMVATASTSQSSFGFADLDFMEPVPMNAPYLDPSTFTETGFFSAALADAMTSDAAYGYTDAGFAAGMGGLRAQGGYNPPLPIAGNMYGNGSFHPGHVTHPAPTSFNGPQPVVWFNNPYNLPSSFAMSGLGTTAMSSSMSDIPSMTAVPRVLAAPPCSSSLPVAAATAAHPTIAPMSWHVATSAMPPTPTAAAMSPAPVTAATPSTLATAVVPSTPTIPAVPNAPMLSTSLTDHPTEVLHDTTLRVNNAPAPPATQGASGDQQQLVPSNSVGSAPEAVSDDGAAPTTRPQRQHRLPDRFRDSVDGVSVGKKENPPLDKENTSSKGSGSKQKKRKATGDADAGVNVLKKKARGK